MFLFFFTGNRCIIGTQSKIYGWAFMRKKLTAQSRYLFFPKKLTIDFWVGSRYGSWQYCQKNGHLKDIFLVMKTSCVFILITHALLSRINQKNVLQKKITDLTFEVRNLVLDSRWLNHWKWLAPDLMFGSWIFCQTERDWIAFRSLSCPNPIKWLCPTQSLQKWTSRVNFDLPKVWKLIINFNTENLCISSHGRS